MKGIFITFEKTAEGLGGTTQSQLLVDKLMQEGYDALYTREPGGTQLGRELRKILLDPTRKVTGQELSKAAELFIFQADRAQHYKEVLKPALSEGTIVVCDRYVDSTFTYQGSGKGWKMATLLRLHSIATGALMPDLTFVLHGTTHRKVPNNDAFETLDTDFFTKVKNGMLDLAASSSRYVPVDANRPVKDVALEVYCTVQKRFESKLKRISGVHP